MNGSTIPTQASTSNAKLHGLSSTPYVFTKLLKLVVRRLGIRVVLYLDDILIMASSREEARAHLAAAVHLLIDSSGVYPQPQRKHSINLLDKLNLLMTFKIFLALGAEII